MENPFPSLEPFGKEKLEARGKENFLQLLAAACQKHKNHKLKMKWQLGFVRKEGFSIKNASSVRFCL